MPAKKADLTTQAAVARALGCSTLSMRLWRQKFPDCPKKVDGKEPLQAWKDWHAVNKADAEGATDAELQKREELKTQKLREEVIQKQKQNRELDQKYEIMRGKYIPRDEVETGLAPLVAELMQLIADRDIETSNYSPGRTTGEMRAHLTETRDAMFHSIREGVTGFIDTAQSVGQLRLASEPTSVNAPGAGRPRDPKSERSKKRVAKVKGAKKK